MNIDKAISIKVEGKQYVDYKDLNHFQGDLKSISKESFQKLKESLIKDGLPLALHIWIDDKGKMWTLDGHHRVLAFKALEAEGYFIPPIPVNIVDASPSESKTILSTSLGLAPTISFFFFANSSTTNFKECSSSDLFSCELSNLYLTE